MPSILDRQLNFRGTPQEKICAEAMFSLTTAYKLGGKGAEATDGAHGNQLKRTIDCSGFVVKVFDKVFSNSGLSTSVHNVAALRTAKQFTTVSVPQKGDIICWSGHVGIVVDPGSGQFIGAQTSTGVAIASYTNGFWAKEHNRIFRRWASLV